MDIMGAKQRILVIDDEPTVLDVIRKILEFAGYEVVVAQNGQQGVDLFREQPYDLVVTDMVMPVKDGLQTILDLRVDSPDVPIVAISGGGNISKERYLAVAGYLDRVETVAKPFSVEALTNAVKKMLGENTDSV
ncbi:MAG: response regulator [Desulfotalea sp.]|nr:MAG: response regulator [Desulfotalea sp.]